MAPIKFEENIREKLEERTINPSAKSWNALASRLDEVPIKKKTNRFWFISVAASFVGVLLLITGVVNYKNEESKVAVETEINPTKDRVTISKDAILLDGSKIEEVVEAGGKEEKVIEADGVKQQFVKKNRVNIANTTSKDKFRSINTENNVKTIKKRKNSESVNVKRDYIALNVKQDDIKAVTIQNAITTEQNMVVTSSNAKNKVIVTDKELDALLNNAQRDIAKKTSTNPVPLDYNELLQDVEDNLEESFRDKILKTVKGGYHSVKSYVAERNE